MIMYFATKTAFVVISNITNEVLFKRETAFDCYTENAVEAQIWARGNAVEIAKRIINEQGLKKEDPQVFTTIESCRYHA